MKTFEKLLTANDTGETGGHQAGVHIPKSQTDLIRLLPCLDPAKKNPDVWLDMVDSTGVKWRFRYVYYNNRLHDEGGTRDEYRITHMTRFFRAVGACEGDILVISTSPGSQCLAISVRKAAQNQGAETEASKPIQLRGWRRVH